MFSNSHMHIILSINFCNVFGKVFVSNISSLYTLNIMHGISHWNYIEFNRRNIQVNIIRSWFNMMIWIEVLKGGLEINNIHLFIYCYFINSNIHQPLREGIEKFFVNITKTYFCCILLSEVVCFVAYCYTITAHH